MSTDHSYELLCLENPLLDIQAEGCVLVFSRDIRHSADTMMSGRDEALLNRYGLKANDAILAEPQHMPLFDELIRRGAKLMAGGGAQNTARGAQVRSCHVLLQRRFNPNQS
jgi:adenosine kinase